MHRIMMKSKIHRATITGADLNYVGSITLDPRLMELADIREHEQVHVLDIDNGARFETYAIQGGPGDVILNGAAARLVHPGDKVIVITYAQYDEAELERLRAARRARRRAQPTDHALGPRGRAVTRPTVRRVPSLMPVPTTDVLVLGSGVAGLSAAVRARRAGLSVTVLTKGELGWSATRYAQGGVAAALDRRRRLARAARLRHARRRWRPLRHRRGARAGQRGPRPRPRAHGARRPLRPGRRATASCARAREGGHSVARVVHAGGDATGAEIERALVAAVAGVRRRRPRRLARVRPARRGRPRRRRVASGPDRRRRGACGPATSSSRPAARGSASRSPPTRRCRPATASPWPCAPASPSPTSSSCSSTRPRCTTRRCRGRCSPRRCAARARSCATSTASRSWPTSTRWPTSRHATSSPRRSAVGSSSATSTTCGSTPPRIDDFPARFPTIWEACRAVGLDPTRDWLPVAPAAHYLSGGVCTDLDGATTLPGLWACGEAACSGVHGANRLASNSLLDGLVFARARGRGDRRRARTAPDATGVLRGIAVARARSPVPRGVADAPGRGRSATSCNG